MGGFSDLTTRIDGLSSRAAGVREDARLLVEIEDVLAEGYIEALRGEARSRRLGERLQRLVVITDEPGVAVELRRLALERRSLDAGVEELRTRLSILRRHFIRLGGGHPAAR